jgi:hypothetical protein
MNRNSLFNKILLEVALENAKEGGTGVLFSDVNDRVDLLMEDFEESRELCCKFYRWLDECKDNIHPDNTVETAFATFYERHVKK